MSVLAHPSPSSLIVPTSAFTVAAPFDARIPTLKSTRVCGTFRSPVCPFPPSCFPEIWDFPECAAVLWTALIVRANVGKLSGICVSFFDRCRGLSFKRARSYSNRSTTRPTVTAPNTHTSYSLLHLPTTVPYCRLDLVTPLPQLPTKWPHPLSPPSAVAANHTCRSSHTHSACTNSPAQPPRANSGTGGQAGVTAVRQLTVLLSAPSVRFARADGARPRVHERGLSVATNTTADALFGVRRRRQRGPHRACAASGAPVWHMRL